MYKALAQHCFEGKTAIHSWWVENQKGRSTGALRKSKKVPTNTARPFHCTDVRALCTFNLRLSKRLLLKGL